MRRRKFLTLLSSAAIACPLVARAQQASKRPTVALVFARATKRSAAFTERLRELGRIEGRTVAIEYRWSEGRPERVAEIAAELVQQKVHVIFMSGDAVAILKQATTSSPIVVVASDPVGGGLVASLSRPGGNVTGLSM
jgi:putative ABC transport system substrate-binding protein